MSSAELHESLLMAQDVGEKGTNGEAGVQVLSTTFIAVVESRGTCYLYSLEGIFFMLEKKYCTWRF